MPRLFVTIALPDTLKDQLATLSNRFDGARWVPAANLHLTLRFIGEVNPDETERIRVALGAIVQPAFFLRVKGVGRFPLNPQDPLRVLWAGLSEKAEIVSLRQTIENSIRALGLPADKQHFMPHITLARVVANGSKIDHLGDCFLKANAALQGKPFRVISFHLWESRTGSGGVSYSTLGSFPLAD